MWPLNWMALGLQKPAEFSRRKPQAGPNLKTAENTIHCFKISKKCINIKIYVKTRSNYKVTGKEIFVKAGHLGC
jgi:hypothetical protein